MQRLTPIGTTLVLLLAVVACGGTQVAPVTDEPSVVTEPDGHDSSAGATADGSDSASDATTVTDAGELVVRGVWSRMSPRRVGVAAIYLELDNRTGADDALVSARVPEDIAGRVELHETYEVVGEDMQAPGSMDAGHGHDEDEAGGDGHATDAPMMAMREVPSIPVPDAATTTLEPGGLHLMLLDLVEDLAPGDTFELTLEFEGAGPLVVGVEVRAHPAP